MRNLKRVLSLALALVMMLSLMIVGAGAAEAKKVDFTDADEIGYNEAVDVMVALEVIQGTDTGAFNPKGVLTREAAAKIICYMLLGADNAENLTTNTQIFTDVAAGRWSAGYIAYCANLGILAGTGDGSFNPEGQLTGVAFGKMLLVALGYRADIEGYVGANWATAIASDMVDAGIAVNGVVLSNPLTREQAAQMAFQTLTADMVRYSQEPVTVTTAEGVSVIVNAPAAEHVYAVSGQNYNSAPTGSHDAVYQQYCEKYYNRLALTAGEDDFDRPAATWKYNGKVIGSYMETPDLTYTKAVKLSDIYKDLSLNKTVAADQVEFSRNGKDETVAAKITDNSSTPVNLDTLGLSKATGNKIGGKGVLTQVWWDNDDEVATITMIDTYVGKVASVVKATGSADRYVTVGSTTSYGSLTTLNNKFETEKFDTDDLVIFTAAYNGSKYDVKTMEALELSATAVLTRWEGSSVATSDKGTSESKFTAGETYEYSQNSLVVDKEGVSSTISAFKVNESEINVYLDKYGYAIYVSGVEGETNYAAVIGIGSSNTHGSETKGVTLLLPDGTKQTVTAKMDDWSVMTTVTGTASSPNYTNLSTADLTTGKNLVDDGIADLVTYSVGSDGVYKLSPVGEKVLDPDGTPKTVYSGKYDIAPTHTDTTFVNGRSEMKIKSNFGGTASGGTVTAGQGTYYTTSKTIFMVATQKKTDNMAGNAYEGRNYNVYVGYENAPSFFTTSDAIHGIAFATNKQYANQIDVVYIDAQKMAGVSGADTYFVKDGSDIITTSDGKYYNLPAVIKGELTTVLIDAETKANWNGNTPGGHKLETAPKGVYAIENIIKNSKGIVTSCDLVAFNVSDNRGTVKDRNDVLGIGTNVKTATYWSYTSDVKVYYVDKDWKVSAISMSDIQTDADDFVYAMHDNDPNQKKLTHVFVREFETPAAATYALSYAAPSGISGLTVVDSASGSGIANGSEINSGITVRVTATVEGGKKATVKVNGTTVGTITGTGDVTFSMPAQASTITFVLTNANAYNGTLKFDTSTPSTTTVEWTSNETPAVAPTYDELYSALLAEIIGQGYDKEGLEDSSNGTNPSFKATKRNGIGIGTAQQPTFTLTVSTGLTQAVAASTQAELDTALAGAADKIKLTATTATLAASTAKDIEVASGSTLTISHASTAIALAGDVTGDGNVTVSGNATVTGGTKIAVKGKVTLARGIDALDNVQGNVDVTENATVTGALSMDTGKVLTITDGKTLTVSGNATIPGSVTATGTATGGTLNLNGADSVGNIDSKVNLTNTAGTLAINGTATPKALTWTAGKITVAATGSLTLPANATVHTDGLEVNGTVKLAGKLTVAGASKLDIKSTGILDLDGKELAGAAGVKVGVTAGAKIKNVSGTKFYANGSNTEITADITVAGSTVTYDYGTTYGANSDQTGWKANA